MGVTSHLTQRLWHPEGDLAEGSTQRYGAHTPVWFEGNDTMDSGLAREKAIKGCKRAWKMALIEKSNPQWRDLYEELK